MSADLELTFYHVTIWQVDVEVLVASTPHSKLPFLKEKRKTKVLLSVCTYNSNAQS